MKQTLAMFFWRISALALFSLNGCTSTPDLQARQATAASAAPPGYEQRIIRTQTFDLLSYAPVEKISLSEITIFIEGDGFAWETRSRPSDDPTPITQTVLALMTERGRRDAIYLARPCQFVGAESRGCSKRLWTGSRYSEPTVTALNQALSLLKVEYNTQRFILVGYSGGGTMAALLAARREDVSAFITLAAPLDIVAFTEHHSVTPMDQSLNPIDVAPALSGIPQIHYYGENDEVVPPTLIKTYLNALGATNCVQVISVAADHWNGWTDIRPRMTDLIPICREHPQ